MSNILTQPNPANPPAYHLDRSQFAPDTAGRIMSTGFATVDRALTAEQALAAIRYQAPYAKTIYIIYVVGSDYHLDGAVSLRELLIAHPDTPVTEIMVQPPVAVTTDTEETKVARMLADRDFLAVPVVNEAFQLVGIVTVDDAMDVLEDETTEDLYYHTGLASLSDIQGKESNRSEVMVRGSLWSIWKVRLPFLVLTLVGGMLAAGVVDGFEETLESVAAVAMFIPLIMDMGGSVGTQSSTVFARGVALGQIDPAQFWRPFFKELGVGSSLGAIAGLAGGLLAGFWTGIPQLGMAVGAALVVTMTISALLGFLVPWLLVKVGADHAAGSAPIITSIKDITGLTIYFTFVTLLLSHML